MVIGIGGVSRSGKSLMAQTIREMYPGKEIIILSQDDYVIPPEQIPRIHDEIDWECPGSMDFGKFYSALVHAHHDSDMVIGEGILVFYTPELNRLFDRKIFITISRPTFRQRKMLDRRWGDFPDWYVDHIWKSYERYGSLNSNRKDVLYVDGERAFDTDRIRHYIETGIQQP